MSEDGSPDKNEDNENEEEQEEGEDKFPTAEALEKRAQERREKNLEQIEFEKCKRIRDAGQVFRSTDFDTPEEAVSTVAEELEIVEDDRIETVRVPPDNRLEE